MSDDLDVMVESAAMAGAAAQGMRLPLMLVKTTDRRTAILAARRSRVELPTKRHGTPWTKEEDDFLYENMGTLSDAELASALGRTEMAVHLRWDRDLSYTSRSKAPDILTCEQIAQGLGMDGKGVKRLIHRGILPGRPLPFESRNVIHVVDRASFLRWAVNPMSWIYFDLRRIGRKPSRARKKFDQEFWDYVYRLCQKRRERWNDAWWRIGKVARYHKCSKSNVINHLIHRGKLPAIQWGNWWVLHSDAKNLVVYPGKGRPGCWKNHWSDGLDAFLILARALRYEWQAIARMTKIKEKTLMFRLFQLKRRGMIPAIIQRNSLRVVYDERTGMLTADPKDFIHRFKRPPMGRRRKHNDR